MLQGITAVSIYNAQQPLLTYGRQDVLHVVRCSDRNKTTIGAEAFTKGNERKST